MDNPGVLVVFLRPESKEIVKTELFVHLRAVPYKPTRPGVGAQYSGAGLGGETGPRPYFPGVSEASGLRNAVAVDRERS